MEKQNYHLTESIESEFTLWFIEKERPNSGKVVFETKNKDEAFVVLNKLNNMKDNCTHKDCKCYNEKYKYNCEVNVFTFEISFCKRYIFS